MNPLVFFVPSWGWGKSREADIKTVTVGRLGRGGKEQNQAGPVPDSSLVPSPKPANLREKAKRSEYTQQTSGKAGVCLPNAGGSLFLVTQIFFFLML